APRSIVDRKTRCNLHVRERRLSRAVHAARANLARKSPRRKRWRGVGRSRTHTHASRYRGIGTQHGEGYAGSPWVNLYPRFPRLELYFKESTGSSAASARAGWAWSTKRCTFDSGNA